RLGANGGRKEKQLRAQQGHGARGLRKPLVPADADPDPPEARRPDLEARIPGAEIALLLVAGAVGNVRLAIDPEGGAVGIQDGDRVEESRPRTLEEADGQHHRQLTRNGTEVPHGPVLRQAASEIQVTYVLLDAEIRRLEKLRKQDDLRSAGRRLAHQLLGLRKI